MTDAPRSPDKEVRTIRDDKGNERKVYTFKVDPIPLNAVLSALGKAKAAQPKGPEGQ